MRKKLNGLVLSLLFLCGMPQKTYANQLFDPHVMKQVALIVASLGITTGGTYLISKTSRGVLNKFCSLAGGSAMIITGLVGIVLSDAIVNEIEKTFTKVVETSS